MKSAAAIIAVGIVLLMMGGLMAALANFRGAEFTEPHNISSGVVSTDIVLANAALDNTTLYVTVTSTEPTDAPVPFAYTSSTRSLHITGLDAAVSRTLSITYKVSQLDNFTDTAARFFPGFLILGLIGIVAGVAVGVWQSRRGGD